MTTLLTLAASLLFTAPADGPSPQADRVTLRGKVVELAEALKAKGVSADPGPISGQVALVTDDGTIVPLLSDEASRALFQDRRLRDRRAEVVGLRVAGLGGCPYAKGATGNVATEDVVYLMNGLGIETGVNLDELVDIGDFISRAIGKPSASRAGKALLAKKGGVEACA